MPEQNLIYHIHYYYSRSQSLKFAQWSCCYYWLWLQCVITDSYFCHDGLTRSSQIYQQPQSTYYDCTATIKNFLICRLHSRQGLSSYAVTSYYTLLTPWSRVLFEKLASLQLVKKFPPLYGTRRFLTALTRARHLSLS